MYKAVEPFTDLLDNNFKYLPGDIYPREGLTPTKKRIDELMSDKNRRHRPVIAEIENEAGEEKEKKPKKGRKKADVK